MSATRSIRARTCSTARRSRCSSTSSKGHKRCMHQLRSLALRAAAARLPCLHRHLSRAHQGLPRQGRRVQSDGRQGVYSGYQSWINRAGRFRSLGDGQVDFAGIFSKLAQYGYDSWAVLEWECCLKHPEDGAAEGAPFIASHIIRVTEKAFDDFAGGATDRKTDPQDAGPSLRQAIEGEQHGFRIEVLQGNRPHPSRHGRRRAGRLHRRRAPHRRPHRRATTNSSPAPCPPTRERAKASAAELGLDA